MEHTTQFFADYLYDAERGRAAIPPITETPMSEELTIDDAYEIQMDNVRRAVAIGNPISGKKIGLTSNGIQQQMGVNEPDYGHLFGTMNCENGEVPIDQLIQPKIEAELAFILKADLTGGKVTREDVIKATDYVVGAFEIVDSRIEDWRIKLIDTVADNASSGRYILGKTKLAVEDADLPNVRMDFYKNGVKIDEGMGSAVLGDPLEAVAWLANRLWTYDVALKKGEVILSGAFTAAPLASKGDEFEAVFSSFGSVKAKFV